MEWFTELVKQDPIIGIIAMLVFGLGGLIHIAILLINRFGWLGKKGPTVSDVYDEVQIMQGNHLHELPEIAANMRASMALATEALKSNGRQEQMLQKMNDTLIEIKTKMK